MKLDSFFSNRKIQAISLFFAFLFSITPFLILSLYNHPSADDFCYTVYANSMDFWSVQVHHYYSWTGRYSATLLLTSSLTDLSNLIDHKVLPVFLFFGFCVSIFYFIKKLVPDANALHKYSLSFIIFFLYIAGVPTISEAFYWKPAALTYQLALILILLFFGLLLHLRREQEKSKIILFTFLTSLLGVVIIGLNETIMIIIIAVFPCLFAVSTYKEKKIDKKMLVILLVLLAATIFELKAPGNLNRMSKKPDRWQLLFSIRETIALSVRYMSYWSVLLISFIVFLFPFLTKTSNLIRIRYKLFNFSFLNLLFYGVLFGGLVVFTFFPAFWSQGGKPPTRTINTIYLLFLLGGLCFVLLGIIYLQNKKMVPKIPSIVTILSGIAFLFLLFIKADNVQEAYTDLFSGRAHNYDLEMKQRYLLLEKCRQDCLIPPLQNRPGTIFSYDLAADPDSDFYYYNKCAQDFFNKESIFINEATANK